MATGAWEHNFPVSKDVHPGYIDWPTVGYDVFIAAMLHEIFTALDDMQDALGYDITGGYADLDTRLDDMRFHDRGDPGSNDFTQANLTTDGTWRDLDLSGIVPAGAKAVSLFVSIRDDLIQQYFGLRKNGNANEFNISLFYTQVANIWNACVLLVAVDSNRVIEYKAANIAWVGITIVVKGWWI